MAKYINNNQLTSINKLDIDSLNHKGSKAFTIDIHFTLNCGHDNKAKDSSTSLKLLSADTLAQKRQQQQAKKAKGASKTENVSLNSQNNAKRYNKADICKNRAQGFGRNQTLPVDNTIQLNPEQCISCKKVFMTNEIKFMIGRRTKAMAQAFLNARFFSWLMSDGYTAYRDYVKRFPCWAHLLRKAESLRKSQLPDVQQFCTALLLLLNRCISFIYAARQQNNEAPIKTRLTLELEKIEQLYLENKDNAHNDAKALAREFLNNCEAIFHMLNMPFAPLTNNEAECALRHWVILRKVIQGTQSEVGKLAMCAVASIIATGKRRGEKFVNTIRNCIVDKLSISHHLYYRLINLSG